MKNGKHDACIVLGESLGVSSPLLCTTTAQVYDRRYLEQRSSRPPACSPNGPEKCQGHDCQGHDSALAAGRGIREQGKPTLAGRKPVIGDRSACAVPTDGRSARGSAASPDSGTVRTRTTAATAGGAGQASARSVVVDLNQRYGVTSSGRASSQVGDASHVQVCSRLRIPACGLVQSQYPRG